MILLMLDLIDLSLNKQSEKKGQQSPSFVSTTDTLRSFKNKTRPFQESRTDRFKNQEQTVRVRPVLDNNFKGQ